MYTYPILDKLTYPFLDEIQDDNVKEFIKGLLKGYNKVIERINNRIIVSQLFTNADTDYTITHNLNRIPEGYYCVDIDQAGVLYNGTVAATRTEITLKCNVAGTTAKILFF